MATKKKAEPMSVDAEIKISKNIIRQALDAADKAPEPKRVWAWGIKGSNGLIYAITTKESNAKAWREQGMDVRELVENDDK